jgi:hypothetical protein
MPLEGAHRSRERPKEGHAAVTTHNKIRAALGDLLPGETVDLPLWEIRATNPTEIGEPMLPMRVLLDSLADGSCCTWSYRNDPNETVVFRRWGEEWFGRG